MRSGLAVDVVIVSTRCGLNRHVEDVKARAQVCGIPCVPLDHTFDDMRGLCELEIMAKRPKQDERQAKTATDDQATELVRVPFNGEHIDAVQRPDGTVWAGVRRMCENLGVAFNAQTERLKRQAWAEGTVRVIRTVANDGKTREMLMLRADRIPMWLAGFDVNRVRPEARPKLAVYQDKAADVLAAYFTPEQARAAGVDVEAIAEEMRRRLEALPRLIEDTVKGVLIGGGVFHPANGIQPPLPIDRAEMGTRRSVKLKKWIGEQAKRCAPLVSPSQDMETVYGYEEWLRARIRFELMRETASSGSTRKWGNFVYDQIFDAMEPLSHKVLQEAKDYCRSRDLPDGYRRAGIIRLERETRPAA